VDDQREGEVWVITEAKTGDSFGRALTQLQQAQKSAKGAPPYSLYVNRPLGRIFAAAAYQLGLTPNQVTGISAAFTCSGLLILAAGSATWLVGVVITVLLLLGYAFDAADGQLARLRGGGSLLGEWLDHMIDSVKVAALHLAVLINLYRNFDLDPAWLLVPIVFAIASSVHFFGMILTDLLGRISRTAVGQLGPPPASADKWKTMLKLPTDYGISCLVFLFFGWHLGFLVLYTFFAGATVGYTVLVAGKWRRDVIALEAIGRG
jgi:phosphatidylglycerophosphate synthase